MPSSAPDLIVVAGCKVGPDGRASPALRRRVEAAIQLPFSSPLLFTGAEREAEVSARLAEAAGVSPERLLREERSTSTYENALFASEVWRETGKDPQQTRVVVVSDRVHLLRCLLLFRRFFGRVEVVGAPSPFRWKLALREVLVFGWYGIGGRLRRRP